MVVPAGGVSFDKYKVYAIFDKKAPVHWHPRHQPSQAITAMLYFMLPTRIADQQAAAQTEATKH